MMRKGRWLSMVAILAEATIAFCGAIAQTAPSPPVVSAAGSQSVELVRAIVWLRW